MDERMNETRVKISRQTSDVTAIEGIDRDV